MIPWFYYGMVAGLPLWAGYLIVSIVLAYSATIVGVIIGKAGYSPFWGFLALSHGLTLIILVRFAWGKWRLRPAAIK